MSYIDNNLMKDEQIIYRADIHWTIYLWAIIWAILSILFILHIITAFKDNSLLGTIFGIFGILSLWQAILYKKSSEYVITNKRLILKTGIIARKSVEIMLTKCEGVSLEQSILGRILGYGTLVTTTGGVTTRFKKIVDPVIFRNHINNQIDEVQSRKPAN